jgi:hypothetical protein
MNGIFADEVLGVPFLMNSRRASFAISCHASSSIQAVFQVWHRSETETFAESLPAGIDEMP